MSARRTAPPPVVEVALAIQFKSAIGFRSFDLGKVAECWSDTLPEVSERPPLGPMAEAWNRLTAVVHDLGRTVPEPSICEVQYVNHLDKHSGWRSVGDTPAVIAPWDGSIGTVMGQRPPMRAQ